MAVSFQSLVTLEEAQIPNEPGWSGVSVLNQATVTTVDFSNDPAFPAASTFTVGPQLSYATNGSEALYARITPGQTGGVSSVNVWVTPGGSTPLFGVGVPVPDFLVNAGSLVTGDELVYTLQQTLRLKAFTALFSAGGAAANRYPSLAIMSAPDLHYGTRYPLAVIPMVPSASPLVANTSTQFSAWIADPIEPFIGVANIPNEAGVDVYSFGLPDLLLPAGTVIETQTSGLQTDDTWEGIFMTFSKA